VLDQRGEHGLIHRCELDQARVQTLQLRLRQASRSTPGVASGERTLCSHLSRISAARGSETARSRRPRSISASEGGSRSRRFARCRDRLHPARDRRNAVVQLHGQVRPLPRRVAGARDERRPHD
jgi:hypothetical protein